MDRIKMDELSKKFIEILPMDKKTVMQVDIFDILESSKNVEILFYDLIKSQNKDTFIDKLIEMEVELDHIHWHYKSFKKEMKEVLGINWDE